ncbi:MAG TPA: hypothetical protein VGI10_06625 [Polyangiaceae bacterium]|jgi:hypothetical protein
MRALVVAAIFAGCSAHYATVEPGHAALVLPHHLAEGTNPDFVPADDGGVPPPAASAEPLKGSQPDPEPLREARQWEYHFVYESGKVRVAGVRELLYPKPVVTARRMGRYAVELWIGHELVERVRFDFPLLAAEGTAQKVAPLHATPTLGAAATADAIVRVPASPRATRAVLVDRASEQLQELPWPPDRQPTPE